MIFSDRVHQLFKKLAEWYLDREPVRALPAEYRRMVAEFGNANPYATRAIWRDFALSLASHAFDDGYNSALVEQGEIDFDATRAEAIANAIDPGWRDVPVDLENEDHVVTEELPPEGIMIDDQLRRLMR